MHVIPTGSKAVHHPAEQPDQIRLQDADGRYPVQRAGGEIT
jgi:hypothetical protein